jgi:hypothetical protein
MMFGHPGRFRLFFGSMRVPRVIRVQTVDAFGKGE